MVGRAVAASSDSDVVVVGGGLAGLAAALYLSRGGLRVTLHEKSRHLGGRARTRTIERFRFNLGPHALYCAGEAAAVLRDLGVRVVPKRPWAALKKKREAARRLNGLRTIDTSVLQNVSLSAWLQHAATDVVRELLEAIVRVSTYTDAPEAISAGAALEQVQRALQGVLYVDGGWQTIVDQLRASSEQAGVEILAGSEVALVIADRRVQGIQLVDGKVQSAPIGVLACGPQDSRGIGP